MENHSNTHNNPHEDNTPGNADGNSGGNCQTGNDTFQKKGITGSQTEKVEGDCLPQKDAGGESNLTPDGDSQTTTAEGKKQRRKIPLLVYLIVLLLGGGVGYSWYFVSRKLIPLLEESLGEYISRPVKLGSIEGVSLTGVSFGKTFIDSTQTDNDYLVAENVTVTINPLDLLNREIKLSIHLNNVRTFLQRDEDGKWLKLNLTPKPSTLPFDFNVSINEIRLSNQYLTVKSNPKDNTHLNFRIPQLTIQPAKTSILVDSTIFLPSGEKITVEGLKKFDERKWKLKVNASSIPTTTVNQLNLFSLPLKLDNGRISASLDLELKQDRLERINGNIQLQGVDLTIPRLPYPLSATTGFIQVTDKQILLQQVNTNLGLIPLVASGFVSRSKGLSLPHGEKLNLQVKIKQPVAIGDVISSLRLPKPKWNLAGFIKGEVNVDGFLEKPIIRGNIVNHQQVKVDRIPINSLAANITIADSLLTIDRLQLKPLVGGEIAAKGKIVLDRKNSNYHIDIESKNIPGGKLTSLYQQTPPIAVGKVIGNYKLSGDWQKPENFLLTGFFRLEAGDGKATVNNLQLTQKSWQADVTVAGISLKEIPFIDCEKWKCDNSRLKGKFRLQGNPNQTAETLATGDFQIDYRGSKINLENTTIRGNSWQTTVKTRGFDIKKLPWGKGIESQSPLPLTDTKINASLLLQGESVTGKRDITIKGKGLIESSQGKAELTNISITGDRLTATAIIHEFSLDRGKVRGKVNVVGNLNHLTLKKTHLQGELKFSQGFAAITNPLFVSFSWNGEYLTIRRGVVDNWVARGIVAYDFSNNKVKNVDLNISGKGVSLSSLPLPSHPLLAYQGKFNFNGKLGGDSSQLQLKGIVILNGFQLAGFSFSPLRGNLQADSQGVSLSLLGDSRQEKLLLRLNPDFSPQKIYLKQGKTTIAATTSQDNPYLSIDLSNIPLATVFQSTRNLLPAIKNIQISGNLSGRVELDVKSLDLLPSRLTIYKPSINHWQGETITAELTKRGEMISIVNGNLTYQNNQYPLQGELLLSKDKPHLKLAINLPPTDIQQLLRSWQIFEFQDIPTIFQTKKYASAKDLYITPQSNNNPTPQPPVNYNQNHQYQSTIINPKEEKHKPFLHSRDSLHDNIIASYKKQPVWLSSSSSTPSPAEKSTVVSWNKENITTGNKINPPVRFISTPLDNHEEITSPSDNNHNAGNQLVFSPTDKATASTPNPVSWKLSASPSSPTSTTPLASHSTTALSFLEGGDGKSVYPTTNTTTTGNTVNFSPLPSSLNNSIATGYDDIGGSISKTTFPENKPKSVLTLSDVKETGNKLLVLPPTPTARESLSEATAFLSSFSPNHPPKENSDFSIPFSPSPADNLTVFLNTTVTSKDKSSLSALSPGNTITPSDKPSVAVSGKDNPVIASFPPSSFPRMTDEIIPSDTKVFCNTEIFKSDSAILPLANQLGLVLSKNITPVSHSQGKSESNIKSSLVFPTGNLNVSLPVSPSSTPSSPPLLLSPPEVWMSSSPPNENTTTSPQRLPVNLPTPLTSLSSRSLTISSELSDSQSALVSSCDNQISLSNNLPPHLSFSGRLGFISPLIIPGYNHNQSALLSFPTSKTVFEDNRESLRTKEGNISPNRRDKGDNRDNKLASASRSISQSREEGIQSAIYPISNSQITSGNYHSPSAFFLSHSSYPQASALLSNPSSSQLTLPWCGKATTVSACDSQIFLPTNHWLSPLSPHGSKTTAGDNPSATSLFPFSLNQSSITPFTNANNSTAFDIYSKDSKEASPFFSPQTVIPANSQSDKQIASPKDNSILLSDRHAPFLPPPKPVCVTPIGEEKSALLFPPLLNSTISCHKPLQKADIYPPLVTISSSPPLYHNTTDKTTIPLHNNPTGGSVNSCRGRIGFLSSCGSNLIISPSFQGDFPPVSFTHLSATQGNTSLYGLHIIGLSPTSFNLPLFEIYTDNQSLFETLEIFEKTEKIVKEKTRGYSRRNLPPLEELKGELEGVVNIGFSKEGLGIGFDVVGGKWQWGKYGGDSFRVAGSYKNGLLTILPVTINSHSGIISLTGTIKGDNISASLVLSDISLSQWQDVVASASLEVDGLLNANVVVSGSRQNPLARGNVSVSNLQINGNDMDGVAATFSLRNSRLDFSVGSNLTTPGESLRLIGGFPFQLFPQSVKPETDAFYVDLALNRDGFSLLNVITNNQLNWLSGDGNVTVKIRGNYSQTLREITNMVAEGVATVENGVIGGSWLADNVIDNIHGKIFFDLNHLTIPSLSANLNGSEIVVTGSLPLVASSATPRVEINPTSRVEINPTPTTTSLLVTVGDVKVNFNNLYVGNASAQVNIYGSLLFPFLGGEVSLSRGIIRLGGGEGDSSFAVWQNGNRLTNRVRLENLLLNIGEGVTVVKPPVVDLKVAGSIILNGGIGSLKPEGIIRLTGGSVNLFTSRLSLAKDYNHIAKFTPENGFNPYLDLLLEGRVFESSRYQFLDKSNPQEIDDSPYFYLNTGEFVRIRAHVNGWLSNNRQLPIYFSSTPQRSQGEIVALLGGGFFGNPSDSDTSLNIAGLASTALFTGIQGEIQKSTGFDFFRLFPVRTSTADNRNSLGVGAELAFDFTDSLFFSAIKLLSSPLPTRYNLRYRLTPHPVINPSPTSRVEINPTPTIFLRTSSDFRRHFLFLLEAESRF